MSTSLQSSFRNSRVNDLSNKYLSRDNNLIYIISITITSDGLFYNLDANELLLVLF